MPRTAAGPRAFRSVESMAAKTVVRRSLTFRVVGRRPFSGVPQTAPSAPQHPSNGRGQPAHRPHPGLDSRPRAAGRARRLSPAEWAYPVTGAVPGDVDEQIDVRAVAGRPAVCGSRSRRMNVALASAPVVRSQRWAPGLCWAGRRESPRVPAHSVGVGISTPRPVLPGQTAGPQAAARLATAPGDSPPAPARARQGDRPGRLKTSARSCQRSRAHRRSIAPLHRRNIRRLDGGLADTGQGCLGVVRAQPEPRPVEGRPASGRPAQPGAIQAGVARRRSRPRVLARLAPDERHELEADADPPLVHLALVPFSEPSAQRRVGGRRYVISRLAVASRRSRPPPVGGGADWRLDRL
jgi:hypothetical protein